MKGPFIPEPQSGLFLPLPGFANVVTGDRLSLGVVPLATHDPDCITHAFRVKSKTRSAYKSDCLSWRPKVLYFYLVTLENRGGTAVAFRLRQFAVVAHNYPGTFGPVNVRDEAKTPPSFLPETGTIPAGATMSGWLTFDGRLDFVPESLTYVDAGQALTITFEGKHLTLSRG